jgi:HlyD family secretion protein
VILGGIALFGLQAIGVVGPSGEPQSAPQFDTSVLEIGDLTVTVSGTGAILPARQTPLLFEYSAPVAEVRVEAGQQVAAGDVLARLDTLDAASAVEQARLAVELGQITLDALTAPPRPEDVAAAEAALDASQASIYAAGSTGASEQEVEIARLSAELARNLLWQTQLQRDQTVIGGLPTFTLADIPEEIYDIPGVSPEEVQLALDELNAFVQTFNGSASQLATTQTQVGLIQAEFNVDIAEAGLEAAQTRGPDQGALGAANAAQLQAQIALDRLLNGPAQADLRRAELDLAQAELALAQADLLLRRTELIAPFDGLIAISNLTVGELPPSDGPAFVLIDTSAYFVDLAIDETDIVSIEPGQPVAIALDALPDAEITGVVDRVAQTPTRIDQLVTYAVRVRLDPTEAPVRVAMTATARIAIVEIQDVLLVRNRFVRIDRATQQAYVTIERQPGQFEEVAVELGARSDTFSEVVSGLEAGQTVILLPRETFIPGVTE